MRVVELIDTGSSNNWDAHGNMQDHRPKALRVDRAIAALIGDLKAARPARADPACDLHRVRPHALDRRPRDARAATTTPRRSRRCSPAAGVKGGHAHGETDEFGISIVADPVHVHDYHATILHLMGIDHTRLVYRYAGRDFRLTDVDGKVISQLLKTLIAREVPAGVVELLETVYLQQEHGKRKSRPLVAGPFPIHPLVEGSTVTNTGQRIGRSS